MRKSVKTLPTTYTCDKCGITYPHPEDRDGCEHWGKFGNGETLQMALARNFAKFVDREIIRDLGVGMAEREAGRWRLKHPSGMKETCKYCGTPAWTNMCDRCWSLAQSIERYLPLIKKIIKEKETT